MKRRNYGDGKKKKRESAKAIRRPNWHSGGSAGSSRKGSMEKLVAQGGVVEKETPPFAARENPSAEGKN